jgi:hypothetical protein
MQNYIAQRQVEMAGEKLISSGLATGLTNGDSVHGEVKEVERDLDRFKGLSTTQMMDHLSRDLVHWQQMIHLAHWQFELASSATNHGLHHLERRFSYGTTLLSFLTDTLRSKHYLHIFYSLYQ